MTTTHILCTSDSHLSSLATRKRSDVLNAMSCDDDESYSVRTIPAMLRSFRLFRLHYLLKDCVNANSADVIKI